MESADEIKLRILAELEELGNENIPAMMNTVALETGNLDELAMMQTALTSLVEGGLVEIHMSSIPTGSVSLSKEDALAEVLRLSNKIKYVASRNHWTDVRMSGPPYFQNPVPEIVRTDSGLQSGIAALEERGYQWWRSKG